MLVTKAHQIAVAVAFVLLTAWLLIGGWQSSQSTHPSIQDRGTAAEQHDTDRQPIEEREKTDEAIARYTWWLMMFTGVLAFATIGLGVATIGLYLTGEKQAKAATVTADAVIDNERPWVGPITTSSQQIAPGQFISATVVIQNSGQTPALEMRAAFKGSIKLKADSADQPDIAHAPPKALFPNVPDWYYPFSKSQILSRTDFDAICNGDKIAWILGKIEYLDNRRRPRYTNICTRWDQSRGVFVPNETGNDAT
jgi:hypothetical protein